MTDFEPIVDSRGIATGNANDTRQDQSIDGEDHSIKKLRLNAMKFTPHVKKKKRGNKNEDTDEEEEG